MAGGSVCLVLDGVWCMGNARECTAQAEGVCTANMYTHVHALKPHTTCTLQLYQKVQNTETFFTECELNLTESL